MIGDGDPHAEASAAETGSSAPRRNLPGLTPLAAEPIDGPVTMLTAGPAELQPTETRRATEERDGRGTALEQPLAPLADRGPDAPWATTFGAVSLADSPTVIAVRGEEVYIGGTFDGEMAGMPAATYVRVAHWDGTSWRRMGDGVDAAVYAIALVGDDVYVGGEFTTVAGGTVEASRLARWDGTAWSPVAGGVSESQSMSPLAVRALASDGTKLYVAGTFESVGTGDGAIAANGFAALDLRTGAWETHDGGLWFMGGAGEGRALELTGDQLYVGGSFDRAGTVETVAFAALDLTTNAWKGFGAGLHNGDLTGTVDSLAFDEATGTIYVGGRFTRADTVTTSGVATLTDGEFGSLGGFTYYRDPQGAIIVALAYAGGRLYAAGFFTAVGDVPVNYWAVHDGSGWSVPAELDNDVFALAAYGDGVVVTGRFGVSGAMRLPHAGIWTGGGWQTFGQGLDHDVHADGFVYAVAATESGLYAGGYFDQAGPVPVASVAEWRDGAWRDMAGGVQMPFALGRVHAMLGVGSDLYVTGTFQTVGGVPASSIARWDGAQWSALGNGIQGNGLALTVLGGKLYVGGGFFQAGDVYASNIAAWDLETHTWSAIGSVPNYDGNVMALAPLLDRYLVIGGQFSKLWSGRFQASGQNSLVLFDTHEAPDPANPVAGYHRVPGVTFTWQPGAVRAMRVLGNQLYVGGTFQRAGVTAWTDPPGDGFDASNLAVWDFVQDTWSTPGGTDHHVTSFTTLDGRSLVIGGWFDHAGPIAASAVVEHDPATGTWTPYGSGIGWGARSGPTVRALAQSPADGLWVGGTFTVAGAAPNCNLALWRGTAGRTP
jgi:trimeric autotransporter adhesin